MPVPGGRPGRGGGRPRSPRAPAGPPYTGYYDRLDFDASDPTQLASTDDEKLAAEELAATARAIHNAGGVWTQPPVIPDLDPRERVEAERVRWRKAQALIASGVITSGSRGGDEAIMRSDTDSGIARHFLRGDPTKPPIVLRETAGQRDAFQSTVGMGRWLTRVRTQKPLGSYAGSLEPARNTAAAVAAERKADRDEAERRNTESDTPLPEADRLTPHNAAQIALEMAIAQTEGGSTHHAHSRRPFTGHVKSWRQSGYAERDPFEPEAGTQRERFMRIAADIMHGGPFAQREVHRGAPRMAPEVYSGSIADRLIPYYDERAFQRVGRTHEVRGVSYDGLMVANFRTSSLHEIGRFSDNGAIAELLVTAAQRDSDDITAREQGTSAYKLAANLLTERETLAMLQLANAAGGRASREDYLARLNELNVDPYDRLGEELISRLPHAYLQFLERSEAKTWAAKCMAEAMRLLDSPNYIPRVERNEQQVSAIETADRRLREVDEQLAARDITDRETVGSFSPAEDRSIREALDDVRDQLRELQIHDPNRTNRLERLFKQRYRYEARLISTDKGAALYTWDGGIVLNRDGEELADKEGRITGYDYCILYEDGSIARVTLGAGGEPTDRFGHIGQAIRAGNYERLRANGTVWTPDGVMDRDDRAVLIEQQPPRAYERRDQLTTEQLKQTTDRVVKVWESSRSREDASDAFYTTAAYAERMEDRVVETEQAIDDLVTNHTELTDRLGNIARDLADLDRIPGDARHADHADRRNALVAEQTAAQSRLNELGDPADDPDLGGGEIARGRQLLLTAHEQANWAHYWVGYLRVRVRPPAPVTRTQGSRATMFADGSVGYTDAYMNSERGDWRIYPDGRSILYYKGVLSGRYQADGTEIT